MSIVSIPFLCAAGTDVGQKREHNEDAFVFDAEHGFFMVVDGMGGHEKGEVAARIAAETIQNGIRKIENSPEIRLRDSIILANNAIYERARKDSSDMGCVLTALLVENDSVTVGHIGDTRLYKIRDGKINRITNDHSLVGMLEEEGELSEKRLLEHPRRNEVTRCVGFEEKSLESEDFVEIYQTDFEADAAFLLCSDGLSDLLTTAQIFQVIEENADSPQIIVEKLLAKANESGGKDNITVIFIAGKDFAEITLKQKNAPTSSRKIVGFILNPWAFLIYGILLGGLIVFLLFRFLFPNTSTP